MTINITIRTFRESDRESIIQLWKTCNLVVPCNDPGKDIDRKLQVQPELLFVACIDDIIVGSVMAGYEGHRGWINYLAVDPHYRNNHVGKRLIEHAETYLKKQGCPKINLQVRASNSGVIEFYKKCGFSIDNVVSMGKRLIGD